MEISTYTFTGDAVTFIGLIGVASTLLILVTAFRRFFNSPYNVRYVPPQKLTTEEPTDTETPVS
jgi:hypothetical protein